MSWSFTLKSFAAIYADMYDGVDAGTFARRLWGDVYYQPKTRGLRSMAKMAILGSTARHRRLFRGLTLRPSCSPRQQGARATQLAFRGQRVATRLAQKSMISLRLTAFDRLPA